LTVFPLAALAQTTQPAPTEIVAVDSSSPKGALKLLAKSLDEGNADAIRNALVADNDDQRDWAEGMIALSAATGRLQKQAIETFGGEGARALIGDPAAATAAALEQIDQSTIELDGDKATIRPANPDEEPMVVRKTADGTWKVPVASFTGAAAADKLAPIAARYVKQAEAIDQIVKDIAAGKLPTPERAAAAVQKRQLELMMGPDEAPATAPSTTQPSTAPSTG
jgi:hypothetical protein